MGLKELARELRQQPKELLAKANICGFPVRGNNSPLSPEQADFLREHGRKTKPALTVPRPTRTHLIRMWRELQKNAGA